MIKSFYSQSSFMVENPYDEKFCSITVKVTDPVTYLYIIGGGKNFGARRQSDDL